MLFILFYYPHKPISMLGIHRLLFVFVCPQIFCSFITVMFYVGYPISLTHSCLLCFYHCNLRVDVAARLFNKLT